MLTGALIIYDQNKMEAKLSYSTCMDCFTGTCLTVIFISVIETVIVHGLAERKSSNEHKDCNTNGDIQVNVFLESCNIKKSFDIFLFCIERRTWKNYCG